MPEYTISEFLEYMTRLINDRAICKWNIVGKDELYHPFDFVLGLKYYSDYLDGKHPEIPYVSPPPLFRINDLWIAEKGSNILILNSPFDIVVKEQNDFQKRINISWIEMTIDVNKKQTKQSE